MRFDCTCLLILGLLVTRACPAAELEYASIRHLDRTLQAEQALIVAALERRGVLHDREEFQALGQAMLGQLLPEDHRLPALRLVDSEDVNAFTLPNGDIYLNTALLLRLERPEELAFVLLHEWAHHLRGDLQRKLAMAPGGDAWQAMELEADQQAIDWMHRSGWSTQSLEPLLRRLYLSPGRRMLSLEDRLESVRQTVSAETRGWQPPDDRLTRARQWALEQLLSRGSLGGMTIDQATALLQDSASHNAAGMIALATACPQVFRPLQTVDEPWSDPSRLDRWQLLSRALSTHRPAAIRPLHRRQGTPSLPVNYRPEDRLLWTLRGPHLDVIVFEPVVAPEPDCPQAHWADAAITALRQSHPDHDLREMSVQSTPASIRLSARLTDSAGLDWRVQEVLMRSGAGFVRLRATGVDALADDRLSVAFEDIHEQAMSLMSGLEHD